MTKSELKNFIDSLNTQGVSISLNGESLKLDGDKTVLTDEVIEKLKENTEAICKILTAQAKPKRSRTKAKAKESLESKVAESESEKEQAVDVTPVEVKEEADLIAVQYLASVMRNSKTMGLDEAIMKTPTYEEKPELYLNGHSQSIYCDSHEFYKLTADGLIQKCFKCNLLDRKSNEEHHRF